MRHNFRSLSRGITVLFVLLLAVQPSIQAVDKQQPQVTLVRALYASAGKHVEARAYDQAIADYQKADEAIPAFAESQRRMATLLEAQGQVDRARTYWRQVIGADTVDESRQQTQVIVDGLGGEKAQYDELVQAFTCSQMNDFRCVRASFDAQRSLTLPVSFYGAVFYKGVDPKRLAVHGIAFKAIPTEQTSLAFRKDLK